MRESSGCLKGGGLCILADVKGRLYASSLHLSVSLCRQLATSPCAMQEGVAKPPEPPASSSTSTTRDEGPKRQKLGMICHAQTHV